MFTFKAKQQICLNISTIRCLSTYATGRYCLRFYLEEMNCGMQNMGSSLHGHYHSKYAIPVSVIEYKNNINPQQQNNNYNSKIGGTGGKSSNNLPLSQINEHVYTSKPFFLKPSQQIPIYQLCIFKHDINMFNSRYQTDFHNEFVLKCTCELLSIQYNGNGQERVVDTFEGRIKGAGISDSLVIDFYQGTACQVLGSVHSCLYQFEYIYTGGPIRKYIDNKNTYHSNTIANRNHNSKQEKNRIFDNKYINKIESNPIKDNQNYNRINTDYNTNYGNNYEYNYNNSNNVVITNMSFQMYCQTQSKQYVESLLQYLLNEVKKSQEKVNINLQIFQDIILKDNQVKNEPQISVNPPQSPVQTKNNPQKIQRFQHCHQLSPIHPNLHLSVEPNANLQCQQFSNLKILSNLEYSIRSQSGIDIDDAANAKTKERLSIIKQEHEHNSQYNEGDSIELEVDAEDCTLHKNEEDDYIILDEEEEQGPQTNNMEKNNTVYRNIFNNEGKNKRVQKKENAQKGYNQDRVKTEDINYKNLSAIECNEQFFNKTYNQFNTLPKQDEQSSINKRKRKKIFVQSSNSHSIPTTNIKLNLQTNPIQQNTIKSVLQINSSPETIKQKPQNIYAQLQQLEITNKQSFYEEREIPATHTMQPHPNKMQNTSFSDQKKVNQQYSTNKVTIDQFQKILHSNCLTIYQKWRRFINHLTQPQGTLLLIAYHKQYKNRLLSLLGQSIIRFKGSFDIDIYSKQEAQRNKMALQIRNQVLENEKNIAINQFRFYNKNLFCKFKPIMFQEIFTKININKEGEFDVTEKNSKKSYLKVSLTNNISQNCNNVVRHLIILVHGLGACRLDMQKLKIELKRYYRQRVHIVSSSSNQGRTEGDIALMGVRLAHEADQQISKFYDYLEQNETMKVSFIGHSMGGVIIRSALPRLEKYKKFFHSFVTLSSPHVGYYYSSSKLVDVGLWLINNWKKCQSILQLTMQDNNSNLSDGRNNKFNMEDTFLYKLSLEKGLEWFKKITFLASRQDLYVPYFSARIQKHQQCLSDLRRNSQYAIIHSKMIDNILSRITGNVTRIDVNFCITEQSVDNLIGRTAHINFVNNTEFLRLLVAADENVIL